MTFKELQELWPGIEIEDKDRTVLAVLDVLLPMEVVKREISATRGYDDAEAYDTLNFRLKRLKIRLGN